MWHAKPTGGWSIGDDEAFDNAMEMFKAFYNDFGWSRNACMALLGNTAHEGAFNPWRWEGDVIMSTSEWRYWTATSRGGNSSADYNAKDSRGIYISPMRHGGGLWGFTPYDKYLTLYPDVMALPEYGPNFSDRAGKPEDGYAQCYYIATHGEWNGWRVSWADEPLPYFDSLQEFATSDLDVATLTKVWVYGYEGPGFIDPDFEPAERARRLQLRVDDSLWFSNELPLKPGGIRKKTLRLLISRPRYPWWIK